MGNDDLRNPFFEFINPLADKGKNPYVINPFTVLAIGKDLTDKGKIRRIIDLIKRNKTAEEKNEISRAADLINKPLQRIAFELLMPE